MGLAALRKQSEIEPVHENWNGPYIYKDVPKDPWGNDYEYTIPGPDGNSFGIRSFGSDGKEGGDGKNADITSWQN